MKIVKRVGERLLPYWSAAEFRPLLAFAGAGSALWAGSVKLTELGWQWLGERLDWRERLGALAGAGYVVVYYCVQAPHVARFAVPGAVLAWCVAAWWACPPTTAAPLPQDAAKTVTTPQPAHAPDDVRAATLDWIRQQIGDRQGVHLRDLLDHAQQHGMFEGLDVTELRGHLERWDIPVRNRVRVRGLGVTVGIHRDDLPPLPKPLPAPDGQDPPDSELHPA